MGKGDKKSRRGKIYRGSFGKRRPRKKIKNIVITPVAEKVEKEEKKETTVEEVKPEKEKTEKAAVEEKPKKKKSTKKRSKE